ncbi:MAG: hypothetical protein DI605_09165 [Sphingomonas sp.]|nr:MAG: hypothetical protein DI605_09165 [Sphingomonas sp.]
MDGHEPAGRQARYRRAGGIRAQRRQLRRRRRGGGRQGGSGESRENMECAHDHPPSIIEPSSPAIML